MGSGRESVGVSREREMREGSKEGSDGGRGRGDTVLLFLK